LAWPPPVPAPAADGRRPKLTPSHAAHAQQLDDAGEHPVKEVAHLLRVNRTTGYGYLQRPEATHGE
jgi:DNA invertase Pin-like site-specific DNA recombinase